LEVIKFLATVHAGLEVMFDLEPLRRRELVIDVSRELLSQAGVPALKNSERHSFSVYSLNARIARAAAARRLRMLLIFMT